MSASAQGETVSRHKKVTHFDAVADTRRQTVVCHAILDDGSVFVSYGDDHRSAWEEVVPVPGTKRHAELEDGGG